MSDIDERIDVGNLTDEQLRSLKSDVLKRLIEGYKKTRLITSNLDVSHNRHASVHSKG